MYLAQNVCLHDFKSKFETRSLTYISQTIDFVQYFLFRLVFLVTIGPAVVIIGTCIRVSCILHLSMTL